MAIAEYGQLDGLALAELVRRRQVTPADQVAHLGEGDRGRHEPIEQHPKQAADDKDQDEAKDPAEKPAESSPFCPSGP